MSENKTIKVLDDSDLSNGLGDSVKVELPQTKYTNVLRFTVELGTVTDDSGTEQSWNSDAVVDIFDGIKLNANGEKFNIPGELVEFENVYEDGRQVNAQIKLDLRCTYRVSSNEQVVTGALRGVDFSTLQVELQLDQVSNLSTNGTQQSGTEIIVTGLLTRNGSTRAIKNINESVEQVSSGRDQFDLRETGQTNRVVLREDSNLDLDEIEMVLYTDEDEYEITDERMTVINEKNEREAGADLPANFYLVEVGNVDFSEESVRFIRTKTQASSSGKLTVYTIGARGE